MISNRPVLSEMRKTRQELHGLLREQWSGPKKMIKAGSLLVALPDPVTGMIGVPLLLAGIALRSRSSSNLKEVYRKGNEILTSLASLSSYSW